MAPLSTITSHLIAAAVAGASQVRNDQGRPTHVELKMADNTLVTKTDRRSEAAMLQALRMLPGIAIRAEETDEGDKGADEVFFVDPLDGTGAFANGLATSTTIAAYYDARTRKVRSCAIAEAATGRVWAAHEETPTLLMRWNLDTNARESPQDCGHGWPDRGKSLGGKKYIFLDVSHGFKEVLSNTQMARLLTSLTTAGIKLHIPGSNGLIQALVANGAEVAAGSISTAKGGPWDFCGAILVQQAGGFCQGYRKTSSGLVAHDPLDPVGCDILVTANSTAVLETLCKHVLSA